MYIAYIYTWCRWNNANKDNILVRARDANCCSKVYQTTQDFQTLILLASRFKSLVLFDCDEMSGLGSKLWGLNNR